MGNLLPATSLTRSKHQPPERKRQKRKDDPQCHHQTGQWRVDAMLGRYDSRRDHRRHRRFENRYLYRQSFKPQNMDIEDIQKKRRKQQLEPQANTQIGNIPLEMNRIELVTH